MKLGSLCTGYGGLDLAAEHVLGPLHHTWGDHLARLAAASTATPSPLGESNP